MRRILKYIILSVIAVICHDVQEAADISMQQDFIMSNHHEVSFVSGSQRDAGNDCCLPRQISYTGISRLQSCTQNNVNFHKSHSHFIKSGRLMNTAVCCMILDESINTGASISDPSRILATLCKLTI